MNRRHFLRATISVLAVSESLSSMKAENKTGMKSLPQTGKPPTSKLLDLSLLLRAIAEVESGNDDLKVGPRGELSRYQIHANMWYQHRKDLNFQMACNGLRAKDCAMVHLAWLDKNLPRESSVEVSFREYALAWCWHGGLSTWVHERGQAPSGERRRRLNNYAVRVTNLYSDPAFRASHT